MSNYSNFSRTDKPGHGNARIILLVALVAIIVIFLCGSVFRARADNGTESDNSTAEIIGVLDEDALNALLASLDEKAQAIFGGDFIGVLGDIVSGKVSIDYSSFFAYLLSLVGTSLEGVMWLLVTIISVSVLYSVIGGMKSKFSSETVSKTVHIASMISIITVVAATTYSMIESCRDMVLAMTNQMTVLFPIIFSLMAAMGASTTASVYQPALSLIASGIMELISSVFIPMILFAFVFMTVGSVSGQMKLTKMSDFILSAVKWMIGMAFFLLCAFLSIQGITASVFDSISIRTAKMTVGKYLPVIGNYLSEGINLILSGSVIVKNALGYTAIILLILSILPVVVNLIIYSLVLKLAAAITEPLGDEMMSKFLSKVSGIVSILIAITLGAAFIYFIFILLIVMTGNISV